MNNNISENLFQAIDILTAQKLSGLKYDKTLLCKITDDSKKARGEYQVTDGSSIFTAYSDVTTYGDGISVYVTVPEGNFENRKIITGKYVEENGQFYTFKEPFEDFLDITDNIIEEDVARSELIANGPIKEKVLWRWLRDGDGIKTGDTITAVNYSKLIKELPGMKEYFKRIDSGEYQFIKGMNNSGDIEESFYLLYTAETQAEIVYKNNLINIDNQIAKAKQFEQYYKDYLEGATWFNDYNNSGTIWGDSYRLIDWKKDLVDGQASYSEFINAVDYFAYTAAQDITTFLGYNPSMLAEYSSTLNNNWGTTTGTNLRKQIATTFFTDLVKEIDNYNKAKNQTREDYETEVIKNHLNLLSFIDELANKNLLPKEYTRLGISAEFSTWLKSFGTCYGTYGLRLDVTSREVSDVNSGASTKKYYSYYLDSSEFYGNIYDFASFYHQSKIFDISMVTEIEAMRLVFYQNGDFKTIDKIDIPAEGSIRLQNPYIALGFSANEFDEDKVFLYTLDGETYDAVSQKVGENALNHNRKTLKARWAHKLEDGHTLLIDKESELEEMDCMPKLHWYKMKLEQGVCDELAGNFWVELTDNLNRMSLVVDPDITAQNERYRLIIEYPSLEWINDNRLAGLQAIETDLDASQKSEMIEKYLSGIQLEELEEQYKDYPDVFKIIELFYQDADNIDYQYNDGMVKYYYSDTLLLENETQIPNQATLDLVQGLKIITDAAGLKGNYCIYEMTNEIMTASEASRLRTLEATYESLITREPSLDKASVIFWKFPAYNTMIQTPVVGKEFITEAYVNAHAEEYKDGFDLGECALPSYNGVEYIQIDNQGNHTLVEHDGYYIICRKGTENYNLTEEEINEGKSSQQINVIQNYRISNYYMQSSTNNDIICEVVKNGLTYKANSKMVFGPKGTNGTDCTLIINFQDDKQALCGADDTIIAEVHLYDHENKEVEIQNATWSFFSTDGQLAFKNIAQVDKTIKVTKVNEEGMLEEHDETMKINIVEICKNTDESFKPPFIHNILQVSVRYGVVTVGEKAADAYDEKGEEIPENTETRDVTLQAFMPIPYYYIPEGKSATVRTADIPTRIVYDNNGTNPSYYSQPFNFTALAGDNLAIGNCEIMYHGWDKPNDKNYVYYPRVKHYDNDENTMYGGKWSLLPLTMYMSDLDNRVTLKCELEDGSVWYQPILVIQNRWASAMLNAWDGSLTIDEKNGTILATMVGAGRKESDNTFTGVLMGDVESVNSDSQKIKQTGVYGFNHGQQSFGLKDDGTAFFGKSGKGQIQFNGNKGIIQSMSYAEDLGSGMMIDLDDGVIDMRGAVYNIRAIAEQYHANVVDKLEEVPDLISTVDKMEEYLNQLALEREAIRVEAEEIRAHLQEGEVWEDTPEYQRLYEEAEQLLKEKKYLENRQKLEEYINTDYTVAQYTPIGSRVHIDTLDPYFYVETGTADDPLGEGKPRRIIHVGANKYYLRTANYQLEQDAVFDEYGNMIRKKAPGKGLLFNLGEGELLGYNFRLRGVNSTEGDPLDGSYFELNSSGNPFLRVHYVNADSDIEETKTKGIDLINITNKDFIMKSQNWQQEVAAKLDDAGLPITEHKVGSGLQINMNKGKILGYNFNLKGYHSIEDDNHGSFFEMDSDGKPYLRVFHKDNSAETQNARDGLDLLYIGKDKYLLQSKNWQKEKKTTDESGYTYYETYGSGLQFDLDKGRFTGYDFELKVVNSIPGDEFNGSYVTLCSDGSPYFKVHYNHTYSGLNNDILEITKDKFVMCSHGYNSGNRTGCKFDVANGEFIAYGSDYSGGYIRIKSTGDGEPYLKINSDEDNTLLCVGADNFYLKSHGYDDVNEETAAENKTGVKFDLKNGALTAHNFTIKAGSGNEKIYIDSNDGTTPLKIGSNFEVDWSGNTKIKGELEVSGTTTISDNLYITGTCDIGGNTTISSDARITGALTVEGSINSSTSGRYSFTSDGGDIAGWAIKEGELEGGDILLNSSGAIYLGSNGKIAASSTAGTTITLTDDLVTFNGNFKSAGKLAVGGVDVDENYTLYVGGVTVIGGQLYTISEGNSTPIPTTGYDSDVTVEIDTPWSLDIGKMVFRNGLLISTENIAQSSSGVQDDKKYVTSAQLRDALSGYATTAEVNSAISNHVSGYHSS